MNLELWNVGKCEERTLYNASKWNSIRNCALLHFYWKTGTLSSLQDLNSHFRSCYEENSLVFLLQAVCQQCSQDKYSYLCSMVKARPVICCILLVREGLVLLPPLAVVVSQKHVVFGCSFACPIREMASQVVPSKSWTRGVRTATLSSPAPRRPFWPAGACRHPPAGGVSPRGLGWATMRGSLATKGGLGWGTAPAFPQRHLLTCTSSLPGTCPPAKAEHSTRSEFKIIWEPKTTRITVYRAAGGVCACRWSEALPQNHLLQEPASQPASCPLVPPCRAPCISHLGMRFQLRLF